MTTETARLTKTIENQRAAWKNVHSIAAEISALDTEIAGIQAKLSAAESDDSVSLEKAAKTVADTGHLLTLAKARRVRVSERLAVAAQAAASLSQRSTSTAVKDALRALSNLYLWRRIDLLKAEALKWIPDAHIHDFNASRGLQKLLYNLAEYDQEFLAIGAASSYQQSSNHAASESEFEHAAKYLLERPNDIDAGFALEAAQYAKIQAIQARGAMPPIFPWEGIKIKDAA